MKYLITGITGFAGPHLAKLLLQKGHEVCGLIRSSHGREVSIQDVVPEILYSQIKFIFGNLDHDRSIEEVFANEKFDGVFHLAAQSHPPTSFKDPAGTFRTNAQATIQIADSIARYQPECKLMFCSTSEVYGASPEEKGPITEDFPINPINPYGVSKAAADCYVRERANSTKNSARPLQFFVTRAFSHTGQRRGRNFSISSDAYQIVRILHGLQEPKINVGTLSSVRFVMDVRDCVRAYALLMEKFTPGEAYNVGGMELFSMGELLDVMLELEGLTGKVEKVVDPRLVRPIDIPVQICNTDKVKALTGWVPAIPMSVCLEDLLEYWHREIRSEASEPVTV